YCAFEKKIPFISYPTAASVDGFVSGVAAMTWYGQKLTFESAPPIAVFASPAVFCTAPDRLTAAGVGDVFGNYTSLFDWKIGRILTGEYYCEEIAGLEVDAMNDLREVMFNKDAYTAEDYTTRVMNALLLSGLAMQLAGNSRPASGAEHHMSHLWEMARLNEDTDALHGEKVAVGLLAVLRTYKKYLANVDIDAIRAIDVKKVMDRAYLEPVYGELTDGILKENMPDGTPASSSLSKIRIDDADAVLAQIADAARDLPELEEIENLLKIAGATCTTAQIGLPAEDAFTEKTLTYAPYVRNRLSLLKVIKAAEMK
ncbi:MAG: iron-containing alcohol dehydrogenase, partial [Clostridia bacterium]|nr:iron-containing alcohol dehydrogenase [Clostridia bacterium]